MPVARMSNSAMLNKLASGGGQDFGVPRNWTQATYGSGWPIRPVNAPRDQELPRSIDYPISVNSSLNPRTGWGLMSFAALYEAYMNVTEIANPVSTFWRTMTSFRPRLIDSSGNEVKNHEFSWMTVSPNRKDPFSVWLTRFLKSSKIYDAPALFFGTDSNGQINLMDYVDGSTLFVIIDEYGHIPAPESVEAYYNNYYAKPHNPAVTQNGANQAAGTIEQWLQQFQLRVQQNKPVPTKIPAFTQIIKGTPFAWWDQDQIWYTPTSPRVNAPYGESFIENAWSWIQLIVSITAFELGHYKTGNMPEGFMTLPEKQYNSPASILAAEIAYNARMSSNAATERMRLRMFPDGTKYIPTKKPDFPLPLYKTAVQNVLHAAGIPPSEYGDVPGQGLGGKGFKEGSLDDLQRNMINPARAFIAAPFNNVLTRCGVTDVTFDLAYPIEEIDPGQLKQDVYEGMAHGVLTMNDAQAQLKMKPIGDPNDPNNIANMHLIAMGNNVYVIERMDVQNGLAVPAFNGAGQGGNNPPAGPETAMEQDGGQHSGQDFNTIQSAIRHAMESGTLDGKTISIPSGKKLVAKVAPVNSLHEHNETIVDMLNDYAEGQTAELPVETVESTVSTPSTRPADKVIFTSVKLDKHCGVCPDDDDYFGAPISREITLPFPNLNHANGVEIVAMTPGGGLPPKAALWKPEGDEVEALQDWIGGPQYPREEAAYLLDRALGFMMVPVAYVTWADNEAGAAVYYTFGAGAALDMSQYAPAWLERAAVFDYISGQIDRGYHHNMLSHPDDPTRPVLIDNGLSFPVDPLHKPDSIFCEAWTGMPLSDDTAMAVQMLLGDASVWSDIQRLVGLQATQNARIRAQRVIEMRIVPPCEATNVAS